MRLLDVPTQMFGMMSGPLLLNRLRAQKGPRRHFWMRIATLGLVVGAIGLFGSIAIAAHLVDTVFDKSKWSGIGDVVVVMTLFYGGVALFNPLHDVVALSIKTAWQLAVNAMALLALVAAILSFGALSIELLYVVGLISIARAATHVLFVWVEREVPLARAEDLVPESPAAR